MTGVNIQQTDKNAGSGLRETFLLLNPSCEEKSFWFYMPVAVNSICSFELCFFSIPNFFLVLFLKNRKKVLHDIENQYLVKKNKKN